MLIPPQIPDGLSDAFAADPGKQWQWEAFAQGSLVRSPGLGHIVGDLRQRRAVFLGPNGFSVASLVQVSLGSEQLAGVNEHGRRQDR